MRAGRHVFEWTAGGFEKGLPKSESAKRMNCGLPTGNFRFFHGLGIKFPEFLDAPDLLPYYL